MIDFKKYILLKIIILILSVQLLRTLLGLFQGLLGLPEGAHTGCKQEEHTQEHIKLEASKINEM